MSKPRPKQTKAALTHPRSGAPVRLRECSCAMGGDHLDASQSVIKRVKVVGQKSKNDRFYTDECLDKIVSSRVYEGAKVYFDHRKKGNPGEAMPDRSVMSRFGLLENIRREGDAVWGDLRYNPGHLYAGTVLGWIDTDPNALGLSHDVLARRHFADDGTMIVEEIVEVHSVDLVEDPATTQGLFESLTTPKEIPAMDPLLGTETADETAVETPEVKTLAQKIGELIAHICDDAGMDDAAKQKKLKTIMKLLSDEAEEETPAPEADEEIPLEEDEDMEEAEESVKKSKDKHAKKILAALQESRSKLETYTIKEARVKAEKKARKMCVEAKLPEKAITDLFVETLTEAVDDARRAKLIEDRKIGLGTFKNPTSQGQGKAGDKKKPTLDDLLAGV